VSRASWWQPSAFSTDGIIEACAGPGGWSTGARMAGHTGPAYGIDINPWACRTAAAAGHHRIQADITTFPLDHLVGSFDGVIISPDCKGWSIAGNQAGLDHPRGKLINEPLRWTLTLQPRWTAWECTPNHAVLDRFAADAERLTDDGYNVWTGTVRAEQFGVPSTRTRAVLIARRDGVPVHAPIPTHTTPVTMAEALGWDGAELVSNYGTNGDPRRRGRRSMDKPSFTITGKCGRNYWEWPDGRRRRLTVAEAGVLQSFPRDYPWKGGSIVQQQQVGDTMPAKLAAKLLDDVLRPAAERAA